MMADPRTLADPRASLADPREHRAVNVADERGIITVCTCGMPNCPRVPHHPSPHGLTIPSEGHLVAASHGLPGLPLGAAPVGHVDPALLYQMNAAYHGLNENPEVLRAMPQLNGYYPYDPSSVYPYMNGYGGIDARRKNATKESTNTLKAWLYEHRKNPYPTKGEKIMLAILTKMTLTQVSTWFANARRRLKKENKVTWTTKDDDLDDDDVNSDAEGADISGNSGDGEKRHHGSVGDDDLSVISDDDRSEIDVEDHDDDPRIPPVLPHTLPPMFLNQAHDIHPLQRPSSPRECPSDDNHEQQRTDIRHSESGRMCSSPSADRVPLVTTITPPPSPGDAKHSQSTPISHSSTSHVHQSTATIHHHPVTSPSSTSPRSSASSLHSSSPPKPKIWSIADVVGSGSSDKLDSKVEAPRPKLSGPSPIVSFGGGPIRHGSIPQGMVIPGAEGPYNLAYYPYGIPHPAAAAMMAAQAQSASLRIPHPYARAAHALAGHPAATAAHLISQASRDQRLLSHPGFPRPHPHMTSSHRPGEPHLHPSMSPSHRPGDFPRRASPERAVDRPSSSPGRNSSDLPNVLKRDETRLPEFSNRQSSPRLSDSTCKPTAFTPVTHRQV